MKVITILVQNGSVGIPKENKPHPLKGGMVGFLECHIQPDLLLIWEEKIELKEIYLARIGTHSELFKK